MLRYLLFLLCIPLFLCGESATQALPAVGTQHRVGQAQGVDVDVLVQSPSAQATPLQIICVFEYMEGDIYNSPPALSKELNGLVHVDEALKGLFTELRKSGKFTGRSLETLLLVPPSNTLPAQKLLLIGLGNRNDFKAENMKWVGIVGMREALRLGVESYSHASDLKDAGISSPTGDVAGFVIQGALEAYKTQSYLKERNASAPLTVKKITLLAGPAYFEDTIAGIQKILSP